MSASENSQEQNLPEKEEFFDAVRRHICQALGFDFVFVDIVREPEIVNLISFSAEDEDKEAREFVATLNDENQQPLMVANTHLAQNVKKTQRPWIGKVFMSGAKAAPEPDLDDDEEAAAENEGYPFSIVPIVHPTGNTGTVRGLIRVLSFDPTREITQQDLATLKLMGEHLSTKMSQFAQADASQPSEQNIVSFDSEFVLIVHNNRLVRRRYSRILAASYQVLEADNAEKALDVMQNNRVDLIVLDAETKGKGGFAFCRILKDSSQYKHVPVILVTSDTNPNARVDGLNVGADDCLSESCFDSELMARVKSFMRHRKTERELAIQLQLLEDYAQRLEQATEHLAQDKQLQLKRNRELELLRWESDILRSQDTLLHRISNTIRQSFNITENLHKMLEAFSGWFNLDCCFVVLPSEDEPEDSIRAEYYNDEEYQVMQQDVDLRTLEVFNKHFQGEQLLMANDAAHDRRLEPFRKDALPNFHFFSLFFVPITYEQKLLGLLGGYKCESQANWNRDNEAFLKSVADQVATGVTNARLYARVQRQATTDGLTGLFNHRTGQEKLAEQLRLAERYQRNLAVVMIDVDHFKSINDNYGHPAGDSVLKSTAKLVKSDCRDVDLPVRYGGEEFLLVLPEVNQEGAAVVAERIRKNLSQEIIHHEDIQISVTASFGIAAFPEDAQNQQQLLDLADKALYLSKRLGRNQVHTAGDLMFEEISPTKLPDPVKAELRRELDEELEADEDDDLEVSEKKEVKPASSNPTSSNLASSNPTPTTSATPKAVPASQLITLPSNTYADFVPTAVSPAAEQKEELVPEVVEMVKALATALYSKSDYNKQHHLETARLSELLAKVMGLSQQQVEQIRVAGLLHDVGTLSIPSDLLNKPGKYNADEREIINQHAVLGAQLLRPIRALRDICEILENHHERWDGTGYPRGLRGEQIPLAARIVSIVDSYHAMISDRPYRDAMTREQAIQTLKSGAGVQWDPFLVDIFVAVLASLNDPRSAPLSAPTPIAPKVTAAPTAPATLSVAPSPVTSGGTPEPSTQEVAAHSTPLPTAAPSTPSAPSTTAAPSIPVAPSTALPATGAPSTPEPVPAAPTPPVESPVLNARQRLLQHSQQHQPLQIKSNPLSAEQAPLFAQPLHEQAAPLSNQPTPLTPQLKEAIDEQSFDDDDDDLPEDDDELDEDDELDNEPEDLAYPDAVSERSERLNPPSALEQLRRVPPNEQQAFFRQGTQPHMPGAPGFTDAPGTTPHTQAPQNIQSQPQQALPQQASAPYTSQPFPAQSFQHTSQPLPQQAPLQQTSQPLPQQAPLQHTSQPLPQQAPPQHTSQPLPQQAPPQHTSQPLPQQEPPQHTSQPLPQQAPPQHTSQPLPQQAPPQHTSQPLPQQAPPQHTSQPLPQQAPPTPPSQPTSPPSSAALFGQPQNAPQRVPQQNAPQNLFPHLQQMQNSYPTQSQPLSRNPLRPQEQPQQPPANPQSEHEQSRAANPDQFYEEP